MASWPLQTSSISQNYFISVNKKTMLKGVASSIVGLNNHLVEKRRDVFSHIWVIIHEQYSIFRIAFSSSNQHLSLFCWVFSKASHQTSPISKVKEPNKFEQKLTSSEEEEEPELLEGNHRSTSSKYTVPTLLPPVAYDSPEIWSGGKWLLPRGILTSKVDPSPNFFFQQTTPY